jgi:hypothetical protein
MSHDRTIATLGETRIQRRTASKEQSRGSGRHPVDTAHRGMLADLPRRYPSPCTCWRRLNCWEERELWLKIWRIFLSQLDASGLLDWKEAFIDASFTPALRLLSSRALSSRWAGRLYHDPINGKKRYFLIQNGPKKGASPLTPTLT